MRFQALGFGSQRLALPAWGLWGALSSQRRKIRANNFKNSPTSGWVPGKGKGCSFRASVTEESVAALDAPNQAVPYRIKWNYWNQSIKLTSMCGLDCSIKSPIQFMWAERNSVFHLFQQAHRRNLAIHPPQTQLEGELATISKVLSTEFQRLCFESEERSLVRRG